MTGSEMCDKLWGEIRQLVLDEGPVPESIDARIAEVGAPEELRETMIANLIALRCADIAQHAPGPYQGAPLAAIMADWTACAATLTAMGGGQ